MFVLFFLLLFSFLSLFGYLLCIYRFHCSHAIRWWSHWECHTVRFTFYILYSNSLLLLSYAIRIYTVYIYGFVFGRFRVYLVSTERLQLSILSQNVSVLDNIQLIQGHKEVAEGVRLYISVAFNQQIEMSR